MESKQQSSRQQSFRNRDTVYIRNDDEEEQAVTAAAAAAVHGSTTAPVPATATASASSIVILQDPTRDRRPLFVTVGSGPDDDDDNNVVQPSKLGERFGRMSEQQRQSTHEQLAKLMEIFQKHSTKRYVQPQQQQDVVDEEDDDDEPRSHRHRHRLHQQQQEQRYNYEPPNFIYEMDRETFIKTFAKDDKATSKSFCGHLYDYLVKPLVEELQEAKHVCYTAGIHNSSTRRKSTHTHDSSVGAVKGGGGGGDGSGAQRESITSIVSGATGNAVNNLPDDSSLTSVERDLQEVTRLVQERAKSIEDEKERLRYVKEKEKLALEEYNYNLRRGNEPTAALIVKCMDLSLDLSTFAHGMLRYLELNKADRIDYIIEMFDMDGDGYISSIELTPLIESAFIESGLGNAISSEQIQEAIESIILSNRGVTSFDELVEGQSSEYSSNASRTGLTYAEVREAIGHCFDHDDDHNTGEGPLLLSTTDGKQGTSKRDLKKEPSINKKKVSKVKKLNESTKESLMKFHERFQKYSKPQNTKQYIINQWRFNRPRMIWLTLYIAVNIMVFVGKFITWTYSD